MPSHTFNWPHPGANTVQLAGAFNDWTPALMTQSANDSSWTLTLELPIGVYEFKFVVDGNWVHDEGQPCRANEMGSWNNVLEVEEAESKEEKAVKRTIEVERKFIVPDNYHELLLSAGFSHDTAFSEHLSDTYYDTADYTLLTANHWLRQRNGDWELKYPVQGDSDGGSKTSLYHECSNPEDISAIMKRLLSAGSEESATSLEERAKNGTLVQYARLETKRQCYTQEDVNVVVDVAEWGFRVGEIEVLIESEAKVADASRKIERLADELAFSALDLVSLSANTC